MTTARPASLVGALRADRPLLVATAALALLSLLPLAVTPILPSPDLHAHAGAGGALLRVLVGDAGARAHYAIDWEVIPYWTTYVILAAGSVAGPFFAAKLLTAVAVMATPLAWMRLLVAMGREPRVALLAFALGWDRTMLAGWHANVLGNALAVVALSFIVQARTPGDGWRVSYGMFVVALSHPLSAGYAALLAFGWALAGPRDAITTRVSQAARASVGLLVVLAPWLIRSLKHTSSTPSVWEWASAGAKLTMLPACTTDLVTGSLGELAQVSVLGVFLVAPMLVGTTRAMVAWVPTLVAAALYAALPLQIAGPIGHWGTYFRFATPMLLGLLVAVEAAPRASWPLWVAPAGTALVVGGLTLAFAGFGTRVRPFLDVYAAAPSGQRVLSIDGADGDARFRAAPMAHLHSYLAAKGDWDAHLYPGMPLRYREPPRLGSAWGRPPRALLERMFETNDALIVQGPRIDEESSTALTLVIDRGEWRLYAIDAKVPR